MNSNTIYRDIPGNIIFTYGKELFLQYDGALMNLNDFYALSLKYI